jgi:preprotein translocase subunit YajC
MGLLVVYFALLAVAFFFVVVLPQRRRLAAHRNFVAALAVGDEVITTGGVFGTIRTVSDDRVGLEVAPGTVLTVARLAIAQAAPAED